VAEVADGLGERLPLPANNVVVKQYGLGVDAPIEDGLLTVPVM
jgi:hypothetical protein